MKRSAERGFTLMEFMIAMGVLLGLLAMVLGFFSRSQSVYSNERGTLDMVQDLRTVFDRFTNEIRMAGAGIAPEYGVISGTENTLVVRGDFANINTTVISKGAGPNVFVVGTTNGFAVGQSVSLYSIETSRSILARITAIAPTTNTITVDSANVTELSSGAGLGDFGAGSVMNVFERRTYTVITQGADKGAIRRIVAYDNVGTIDGAVISDELIARNVQDADDTPGLTFKYFNIGDEELSGVIDPTDVYKVQISLHARTANRDLQDGEYRTLNLTSLVQVRNMYQ